jgi:hypothetical protein
MLCVLHVIQRILCVSIWLVAPTTDVVLRASQANRDGGCGVAGWQDLKTESGDIVDLTPCARQDPLALRTTPFEEGENDEDWHARRTYDM